MLSQLTEYAIKNGATDAKVVLTKDIAVETIWRICSETLNA